MHRNQRATAAAAARWLLVLALFGLATPRLAAQQTPLIVDEVFVHGLHLVSADQIKALMKTQRGRPFDPAVLRDDFNRIAASKLVKPVEMREDQREGRITIHVIVNEYPSVVNEVIYKNAHHLSQDEAETVTGIRKGSPLSPTLNQKACYDLQEWYKKQGRALTTVKLEEGGKAGDRRVVFNVTESPVIRIRHVFYEGNAALATSARLGTQVDSHGTPLGLVQIIGSQYNPAILDNDALKLQEYYKANGYLDVRVSREVQFSDDFTSVDVVFHIHEGTRYRVADVTVEGTDVLVQGQKVLERDHVLSILKMKKGELYNKFVADADKKNITDLYGYRGYKVAVTADEFKPATLDPGLVRVHYQVVVQGPAKVGEIHIIGNEVTKSRVILRVLQFYPGQTLSYPMVGAGERDLKKLGLFEVNPETGVQPTIEVENTDKEYKDIYIRVKEQPTGSLMFGVGVNSNAGLVGSIVLNERNFDLFRPPTSWADLFSGKAFRGGGQEFRAEAVPGTQLQRYSVSIREPFLFDRPISLTSQAYYFDRIYNEYEERRTGGRFTLGKQIDRFWSVTGSVRVENVEIHGVSPYAPPTLLSAQGDHFLLGGRVGVTRDDRDSILRPTEGGVVDLSYEQVTGDYNFPVVNLEASRYFTTFKREDGSGRHVLALRSQVSWTNSNAPVFERFYAGGFNSIRGFQFRGVGPNINGFEVGGDFMFLNSLEYQVPIKANDQLYLVAFIDSGTVESQLTIKDYRVTAGVGARIIVPMLGPVPIALDFAIPIVRGPNDREQLFSFFVGLTRS
jgi:outer membrane protein assembly complex protein YaeT